ncbi:extensin family protein [Sphingomonas panaciterrae]|uniref:extensin-like domain-containing protein n=1 Tax=Sphingomonas panaciterrae TaxID=1462999 RepID=UPI002FEE82E9
MRKRDRAARRVRRTLGVVVALAVVGLLALLAYGWAQRHPQDTPWAPLDLAQPPGLFTGRKLVALGEDFSRCQSLLDRAGVTYTVLAPLREGDNCGYDNALRFAADEPRITPFTPAGLGISCPVAAALALWQWEVVQPAAERHLRMRVTRIDHLGSYNCRRLYGRSSGDYSQHATANAVDIAGFRLADGSRISVLDDWKDGGAKAAFLRDVRDGACKLFATVLSPDYNAAHRDHFHLDQANRGSMSWRSCR